MPLWKELTNEVDDELVVTEILSDMDIVREVQEDQPGSQDEGLLEDDDDKDDDTGESLPVLSSKEAVQCICIRHS